MEALCIRGPPTMSIKSYIQSTTRANLRRRWAVRPSCAVQRFADLVTPSLVVSLSVLRYGIYALRQALA
jgi:hypothetical protein